MPWHVSTYLFSQYCHTPWRVTTKPIKPVEPRYSVAHVIIIKRLPPDGRNRYCGEGWSYVLFRVIRNNIFVNID